MKSKFYILLIGIFLINTLAISQVYTPKGSLVPDTEIRPEQLTSYDIAYIMQYMATSYPNAVIIGNPTTTYNCHAYAWYMSEGGVPSVWMGLTTNPTPIYWNDGSYVETTEKGNGLKVSYDNPPYNGNDMDNHSAITTAENGVFISKWGSYPLVRHAKDYTPYTYSSLHYFKKNTSPPTLSGPSSVCSGSTATFTLANLPSGCTVVWSKNSDLLTWVSTSSNSATIVANNNDAYFLASVSAAVSVGGVPVAALTKKLSINNVNLSIAGASIIGYLKTENYTASISASSCPFTGSYEWWIDGTLVEVGASVLIQSVNLSSNSLNVSASKEETNETRIPIGVPTNIITLTVKAKMKSGTISASASTQITISGAYIVLSRRSAVVPDQSGVETNKAMEVKAYPNPTNDKVMVELFDSDGFPLSSQLVDIRLYDGLGNLLRQATATGGKIEFNVANLPSGIYYLHIYDGINEKPEMRQIVVQH